jgi:hypothetical protein
MIILELDDGAIKKFNFPVGKEQEFYDMWFKHKNKAVKLVGEEIKLSEIFDCYIGEREKEKPQASINTPDMEMLKSFLGIK